MPQEQLDPQVVNMAKAIRQSESGGDFSAQGKSGEHGAYQFTEPTWNKTAAKYGIKASLKDSTPEQQNEAAYRQIKEWKDGGYNPGQIASMWNAGPDEPNAYTGKFSNGQPSVGVNKYNVKFDVPTYAKSVADAYQKLKSGGTAQQDPNNPSASISPAPVQPLQSPESQSAPAPTDSGGIPSTPLNIPEGISTEDPSQVPQQSPQETARYLPLGTRMGTDAAPTAAQGKDAAVGSFKGLISSLPSGEKALDMGRNPDRKLNAAMGVDVDKALAPNSPEQQAGSFQTQAAVMAAQSLPLGEEAAGLLAKPLALRRLSSTADTLTTRELEAQASRVLPSGKLAPSSTETRAADLLAGKTSRNPVKTLESVNSEIATRGKGAETFLETNAKPISNKEDFDAFNAIKDSSKKYMTPAEAKAYDEQINVFQKLLKGYGKYDTSNYYKALKEYESQVTANLPKGKDALLVPGGSARIQAAKDVRKVVRDMIGSKHPEFKGKMFDLASLYDVKDTVAGQVADKAKNSTSFAKRHPGLIKSAKWAGGILATGLLGGGVAGEIIKK